jgi:hypothetical protein
MSASVMMTDPNARVKLVHGWRRGDLKSRVSTLVDTDNSESPFTIVGRLFGDDEYCFHACDNVTVPIPDDAKNKLFTARTSFTTPSRRCGRNSDAGACDHDRSAAQDHTAARAGRRRRHREVR